MATRLDDGTVAASRVMEGGPAGDAGMKPGARILEWGRPVNEALAETSTAWRRPRRPTREQLRFLVRAPVGTDSAVSFKNRGESAARQVTLKAVDDGMETLNMTDGRPAIAVEGWPESMVQRKMLPGNVGYV